MMIMRTLEVTDHGDCSPGNYCTKRLQQEIQEAAWEDMEITQENSWAGFTAFVNARTLNDRQPALLILLMADE